MQNPNSNPQDAVRNRLNRLERMRSKKKSKEDSEKERSAAVKPAEDAKQFTPVLPQTLAKNSRKRRVGYLGSRKPLQNPVSLPSLSLAMTSQPLSRSPSSPTFRDTTASCLSKESSSLPDQTDISRCSLPSQQDSAKNNRKKRLEHLRSRRPSQNALSLSSLSLDMASPPLAIVMEKPTNCLSLQSSSIAGRPEHSRCSLPKQQGGSRIGYGRLMKNDPAEKEKFVKQARLSKKSDTHKKWLEEAVIARVRSSDGFKLRQESANRTTQPSKGAAKKRNLGRLRCAIQASTPRAQASLGKLHGDGDKEGSVLGHEAPNELDGVDGEISSGGEYISENDDDDDCGYFSGDGGIDVKDRHESDGSSGDDEDESIRTLFVPLDLGPPTAECQYCKAIMWFEERNRKSDKSNPKFSLCCQAGKVVLPMFQETPDYLKTLEDPNGGRVSRYYQDHKRYFNSMFAITSMGGNIDYRINDGRGPYLFKLNGQNHHRIGSLLPPPGAMPKYMQLYFHDSKNEISNRLGVFKEEGNNNNLNMEIVSGLQSMLDEINPLVKTFRIARERLQGRPVDEVRIRLIGDRPIDGRQYNLPTASEVAGLIIGSEFGKINKRDVIVECKQGFLQRISELHPAFMSMQYPLLFPYGENGYMPKVPHSTTKAKTLTKMNTISMREHIAYNLQMRNIGGRTLLNGGRLLQQYDVDAYTAIEEERLNYYRRHQNKLRTELYKGLHDAVARGDENADSIGKRIILPSTFTGGPRYMQQNFQDAIAICRFMGPPDLFITVTCNPKWPEIEHGLKHTPGKKSEDRADLISRIFYIRLQLLMDDLCKNKHFGKTIAVTYTIEFQKRGLPHAHILLFLSDPSKFKTARRINKYISAELPDQDKDPIGYKAVVDFMIHGPCGDYNPACACMKFKKNGKFGCSKNFPKKNSDKTTRTDDGFWYYRRRDDGRVHKVKNTQVSNQWVVPHNLDLIVKYQCHINVEVCNQGRAIKYLFKYVNKGKDMSTFVVESNSSKTDRDGKQVINEVDEIHRFQTCRYVSAAEATHRIFGFRIHYRYPAVERLPYHTENEQPVVFKDGAVIKEVIQRETNKRTKFLEYFKTNEENADARELTYVEFPEKWVWNSKTLKWKRREKRVVIGRIHYAHPASGERYYLRILLNHVRGATRHEDYKKVGEREYDTYKEACLARGLLDDDGEWHEALRESTAWASSKQLRDTFISLLIFCEVTDPLNLWNRNWDILGDEFLDLAEDDRKNAVLCELEIGLNNNGRSLRDYPPMPLADMMRYVQRTKNRLIREEICDNPQELRQEYISMFAGLNSEQLEVFETVIDATYNKKGGLYFVYGSGGTGKTFLWRTIMARLRSEGKIVLAVASSGIASLLLPGGRTAHSRFKIPLVVDENSSCNISKGTNLACLIQNADLVIWDEAPMNHKHLFEAVDKTLRDIMKGENPEAENLPFGGKTFVLGGDFRQTLPIITKGCREEIVEASINRSYLWDSCKMFHLQKNMRLENKDLDEGALKSLAEFSDWVLQVGEGTLETVASKDHDEGNWIKIPEDILVPESGNPIDTIIDAVYPDLLTKYSDINYLGDILAPTNESVDEINTTILKKIRMDTKEYRSADTVSPMCSGNNTVDVDYPTEFLNSLSMPGLPNHLLELKVGIPIMLLRNINPSLGLCNGTRLIVLQMLDKTIEAMIITGSHVGDKVTIHRIITISPPGKLHFEMRRRQFPIKVCYAMTINKSQGQTLQNVGIYLPTPVFSHGQLYVAVSRTTSRAGLKIVVKNRKTEPPGCTQNVVFKEVFQNLDQNKKRPPRKRNTPIKDCNVISTESAVIDPDDRLKQPKSVPKTLKRKKGPNNTRYLSVDDVRDASKKFCGERGGSIVGSYYVNQIPATIIPYISNFEDPLGDGNCGFRALCLNMGEEESRWTWMRGMLHHEVEQNRGYYTILFGDDGPDRMLSLLDYSDETHSAPPSKYMDMPSTGFVFSELMNAIVISISTSSCWTCLPTRKHPPQEGFSVYSVAFVQPRHYIKLEFVENCPLPPIPPQYFNIADPSVSDAWVRILSPRLKAWEDLQIPGLMPALNPGDHIMVL